MWWPPWNSLLAVEVPSFRLPLAEIDVVNSIEIERYDSYFYFSYALDRPTQWCLLKIVSYRVLVALVVICTERVDGWRSRRRRICGLSQRSTVRESPIFHRSPPGNKNLFSHFRNLLAPSGPLRSIMPYSTQFGYAKFRTWVVEHVHLISYRRSCVGSRACLYIDLSCLSSYNALTHQFSFITGGSNSHRFSRVRLVWTIHCCRFILTLTWTSC